MGGGHDPFAGIIQIKLKAVYSQPRPPLRSRSSLVSSSLMDGDAGKKSNNRRRAGTGSCCNTLPEEEILIKSGQNTTERPPW